MMTVSVWLADVGIDGNDGHRFHEDGGVVMPGDSYEPHTSIRFGFLHRFDRAVLRACKKLFPDLGC